MLRTKIVCTTGPASSGAALLDRLVAAGMDVARVNFSHGTHAEHAETIRQIRIGEERWGRPIAILQDLQGPKIRLGTFGPAGGGRVDLERSEEHTSELQSLAYLVCRLLLEKKKKKETIQPASTRTHEAPPSTD